jgi:hypothetical protein
VRGKGKENHISLSFGYVYTLSITMVTEATTAVKAVREGEREKVGERE